MGRDDAVNVDTTREQIYSRSTREHIKHFHLVIMILCCNEWIQSAKQSISSVHLHISQVFLLITGRINLFTQSFFVTKSIILQNIFYILTLLFSSICLQKSCKIYLSQILQLIYHVAFQTSSIFTCNICTKYRRLFSGYFSTAYAFQTLILLDFWRSFQRVPWQMKMNRIFIIVV